MYEHCIWMYYLLKIVSGWYFKEILYYWFSRKFESFMANYKKHVFNQNLLKIDVLNYMTYFCYQIWYSYYVLKICLEKSKISDKLNT